MAKRINIGMERSDVRFPWGFSVRGDVIDEVTPGSLAAHHLASGDKVIEIDHRRVTDLQREEVDAIISSTNTKLELLIQKGVSLEIPSTTEYKFITSVDYQHKNNMGKNLDLRDANVEGFDICKKEDENKQCLLNTKCEEEHEMYQNLFPNSNRIDKLTKSEFKSRVSRLYNRINRPRTLLKNEKRDNYIKLQLDNFNRADRKFSSSSTDTDHDSVFNSIKDTKFPSKKVPTTHQATQYDCQGDVTFWEYSPEESGCGETRSSSLEDLNAFKRTEPKRSSLGHFIHKNTSYLPKGYKNLSRTTFRDASQLKNSLNNPSNVTNSKTSSHSEVTKVVRELDSYTGSDGKNAIKKYERLNIIKETETTSKLLEGGKQEVREKTKENKEYTEEKKVYINGQPNETRKTLNDSMVSENIIVNGKTECCRDVNKKTMEVVKKPDNPIYFTNTLQEIVRKPIAHRAEFCGHSVTRDKEVGTVNYANSKNEEQPRKYLSSTEGFIPAMPNLNTRVRDFPKKNDSNFYDQTLTNNVWRRTSKKQRPLSCYLPENEKSAINEERQGDVTFWEVSPDRQSRGHRPIRYSSLVNVHERQMSDDFSYGYSSLTSDVSCPGSNLASPKPWNDKSSFFEKEQYNLKRPSHYWNGSYQTEPIEPKSLIEFAEHPEKSSNTNGEKCPVNPEVKNSSSTVEKSLPGVKKTNPSNLKGNSRSSDIVNWRDEVLENTKNRSGFKSTKETHPIEEENTVNNKEDGPQPETQLSHQEQFKLIQQKFENNTNSSHKTNV